MSKIGLGELGRLFRGFCALARFGVINLHSAGRGPRYFGREDILGIGSTICERQNEWDNVNYWETASASKL